MKKTTLLATGLIFSAAILGGSMTAMASTSTGIITLEQGTGEGNPSDPTNPSQENPDPVRPTSDSGPLILKVVPYFNFGTQTVNQAGATYNDQETVTDYIEVRDNRDAATDGWSVTASRTDFASGATTMPATLTIPQGVVRNSNPTTEQGNEAGPTTAITNGTIVSTGGAIPVGQANTLTVLATTVGSNEVGKANTTSNLTEDENRAQLAIAAGNSSTGTFTSTITWTVTAGATA